MSAVPLTVLVADDLESNRRLIRASIKSEGYNIVEVTNGQEALEFLEKVTVPVVGLVDWEMPELDGLTVCKRARKREFSPPSFLILVTIRDSQADIIAGLQQGANDYIIKPFDYAELLARVKIGAQIVNLQQTLMDQAQELRDALNQIKILTGILPICSYCSKIRDDKNNWEKLDRYVARHSEASFSHGVCPECYREHMIPMLKEAESRSKKTAEKSGDV